MAIKPTGTDSNTRWWSGIALYHIYVRSFCDGDGDGFGDLSGAIGKLDYISSLGVKGVWLSPTMPSPDEDWGYDVSNYLDVHPDYGTLRDLEQFIDAANSRRLKVILDLVPNHTSSKHPWFVAALSDANSPERDYYVFAKGREGGLPPNNWLDATGQSAWTYDKASGEYFLHNFLDSQPDLNWWNKDVHEEFERILRFWFDRGVAGFRIDVAHGIYKDKDLRDDPPAPPEASPMFTHFGLLEKYSKNQEQVHPLFKQWRKLADSYTPPRLLLGETWVGDLGRLALFYGNDDELNLAFNFIFAFSSFTPESLSRAVSDTLSSLAQHGAPVWMASNHDISRFPTRWAEGSSSKSKMALAILTTLPGTVVLYYGDELGMCDVDVPIDLQKDRMTSGVVGSRFQRDRARTPMAWNAGAGRGFCGSAVTPWLPFGPDDGSDVVSQERTSNSTLNLTRTLLNWRSEAIDIHSSYKELEVTATSWRYEIGDLEVFANFSDRNTTVRFLEEGLILATSNNAIVRPNAFANIEVNAWEAVVRRSDKLANIEN